MVSVSWVFDTILLQASDGVLGDHLRDLTPGNRSVGTKPLHGPVECAQKRPGGDRRVGLRQFAAPDAGRDQRTDGAFVAIAPGDHRGAPPGGQGVELEVRRRPLYLFDQTAHVIGSQRAQPRRHRSLAAPGGGGVGQEAIERAVLAEIENLVLAAEVVVKVGGGEVRGHRDIPHASSGKAHRLEHPGGGGEDRGAPRLGPPLPSPR